MVELIALFTAHLASSAHACAVLLPDSYELTGDSDVDTTRPEPPRLTGLDVVRGSSPSCAATWTSDCDEYFGELGWIDVVLEPGLDDVDGADLGYRFASTGGVPPDHFVRDLPTALLPAGGTWPISLEWYDGVSSNQEPFAMALSVVAVDRAGNESEPLEFFVAHPGGAGMPCPDGRGCATASTLGGAAAWPFVGLALFRRRRALRRASAARGSA